jgi:hypothetical protein
MYLRKNFILALFFLLPGLLNLCAQDLSITEYLSECERKYGSDADLVNGVKYYYPYRQSQGDPFFFSEARAAIITIQNKEFEGQQLRYDLFDQRLILDYKDIYGASSSLILRNEWVESFAFENHRFSKLQGPEGEECFFQVVSNGPISCVYKWNKSHLLNLASGVQSYYFTEAVKEPFLLIEGRFYPYRNNRTFLRVFKPDIQKTLKQFMSQGKINVKKASDSQVRHLVEYCNSLSNEDS